MAHSEVVTKWRAVVLAQPSPLAAAVPRQLSFSAGSSCVAELVLIEIFVPDRSEARLPPPPLLARLSLNSDCAPVDLMKTESTGNKQTLIEHRSDRNHEYEESTAHKEIHCWVLFLKSIVVLWLKNRTSAESRRVLHVAILVGLRFCALPGFNIRARSPS